MKFAQYSLVRPLAHTARGPILLVADDTESEYTLRFISLSEYQTNFARIEKLLSTRFKYCANLLKAIPQGKRVGLISEYTPGNSLADLLQRPGEIKPRRASEIQAHLELGLAELHALGIAHTDISPANIIVPADVTEAVKLIDFACATLGTPGYILAEELDDFARDLYALERVGQEIGALPKAGDVEEETTSELTPAALLRAEYQREETQLSNVGRGHRKDFFGGRRTRRHLRKMNSPQISRLRKVLSLTMIGVGLSSLGFWLTAAPENTRAGAVEQAAFKSQLSPVKANTQVCPTDADAEAIVRGLMKLRNQALMQLDAGILERIYVKDSAAYQHDASLISKFSANGTVINRLQANITSVKTTECEADVRITLRYSLSAYEQCSSAGCVEYVASKEREEELTLQTPLWRIKNIKQK